MHSFGTSHANKRFIMPMSELTQIKHTDISRVLSLLKSRRNKEALHHSLDLIEKYPTSEPAIQLLSKAYIAMGDYQSAIEEYSKLANRESPNPQTLQTLGAMYLKNKQPQNAISAYQKILQFAPDDAETHYKIGNAYFEKSDFTRATKYYENALKLKPNFFEALYNLGNTFLHLRDFNKSVELFDKCLVFKPNHKDVLGNLGIALLESGKVGRAIKIFRKLVEIFPSPIAKEYLGRALLLKGQFQTGWKYYEARLHVSNKYPIFLKQKARPFWNGEEGKDIFICPEQGIGDQIMFMSLAKEAQKISKTLTILVDKRLRSICKRSMPDINFISSKEELEEIDFNYQLPIGSLPRLFRNNEADFRKSEVGYLKADQNYVKHLKKKLNLSDRPLVGVSWASFNCLTSDKKSIELQKLQKTLTNFSCDILNLQYGNIKNEVEKFRNDVNFKFVNDHDIDLYNDIEGLAALIQLCDLVVTIPNITIQLTGALGKKGWAIIPSSPNYPWTDYRAKSLWFPSVDIYRQKKISNWTNVLFELEKMALSFSNNSDFKGLLTER